MIVWSRMSTFSRAALAECAADRQDWIGRAGRPDRATTSGPYRRTADFRVSTTDPDATPMPYGERGTRLGYQDHYVVDGGRARIILTALVAPAEVQENQPALDLLWRARFRWKLWPRQVTGDTKYGTVENITAIEAQGVRACFPLSAAGRRRGLFTTTDFVYDVATDTYHCPGGAAAAFPLPMRDDPAASVRGASWGVRRLRLPTAVHYVAARQARGAQPGGDLSGAGARLSRLGGVRQGDAQTQGLGGAIVRRSQGLARPAAVPFAGTGEGQRRGAADRHRSEPEAAAEPVGLGTPSLADRGGRARAADPLADATGSHLTRRVPLSRHHCVPTRWAHPAQAISFSTRRGVIGTRFVS